MQRFVQQIVVVIFVIGLLVEGFAFWKNSGIADSVGPEISMEAEQITVGIEAGEAEILDGVTAWDAKDHDVTDTMVVQGMSNFVEKGVRIATIAAFDHDNNVTKATREVVYNNYQSPRFTLEEPLIYPVGSSNYLTSPFEVTDCLDGDLSMNVSIREKDSNYIDETIAQEHSVIYKVVNSAGDVVEIPATILFYNMSDMNGVPSVELSQYLTYVKKGQAFDPTSFVLGVNLNNSLKTMQEMEALRAANGDDYPGLYRMSDIEIANDVNTDAPGVYEVTYSMKKENGMKSKIRLIVMVEE